jgi:hypothetical protein
MDPVHTVKTSLDAGQTPDQIAHALIYDHQIAPVPAIKAMRTGCNMTLGEAKEVVHRILPLDQQKAAERLWDEAIEFGERMADEER